MEKDLEGELNGEFGTASVDRAPIVVRIWNVGGSDAASLQGFLTLPQADFERHNISISLESKLIPRELVELLSVPVKRTLGTSGLTMEPEIVLRDVKLYDNKDDREPAIGFDAIRVIAGPARSAGLLTMICVNLTRSI